MSPSELFNESLKNTPRVHVEVEAVVGLNLGKTKYCPLLGRKSLSSQRFEGSLGGAWGKIDTTSIPQVAFNMLFMSS